MKTVNFYNKVKEIVIRSSEEVHINPLGSKTTKMLNIKILHALIKELRIKLDVTKWGLGPDKTMRAINQGLKIEKQQGEGDMNETKKRRIEETVLKEFNMINISRIKEALQEAPKEGE